MLVLSRHKNEVIVIGEGPNQIRIMVVEVRGGKVRLGIEAPNSVSVHRLEVFEEIKRKQDRTTSDCSKVEPNQIVSKSDR